MLFQIQVFLTERKPDFVWLFYFQKKPKVFKKYQNFKIWLEKSQIGNPDDQFNSKHILFCVIKI